MEGLSNKRRLYTDETNLGYLVAGADNKPLQIIKYFMYNHKNVLIKDGRLLKRNTVCVCYEDSCFKEDACCCMKPCCYSVKFDAFVDPNNIIFQYKDFDGPHAQTMELNQAIKIDTSGHCKCYICLCCLLPGIWCTSKENTHVYIVLKPVLTHKKLNDNKETPPPYNQ
jgi:hypothetical protein